MAIEDAAALGILFSKAYFGGNVAEALEVYQEIRLPRATKVQASAAKAATNINERIGKLNNQRRDGGQALMLTRVRLLEQHQLQGIQGRR